jgi:hypothetical protein
MVESVTNLLLDFYVAEKTQVKQFFYMMIKGSSNVRSKPHICSVHLKSVLRIRIRDPGLLFDHWIRDPEYIFSVSRISDPGSRIPRPYFLQLFDIFFGKKLYNSLKIGPIIYNFVKFVAT